VDRRERIGIFGGTFDPVHHAHLDIARTALDRAQLDRVVFVVSARPPHKRGGPYASAADRLAMVAAAIEGDGRFEVSRVEIDRPGPSYTVQTLEFMAKSHPNADLFLLLGLDSFLDLPQWKDPERIVARARLLVVRRPNLPDAPPPLLKGRYDVLPFPENALSSTEVRDRIISGAPFEDAVPGPVARLIREKGIYGAHC
jgi:nicotinate-nucleotide adenylyltransferase